jgi:hypothetical protein
MNSDFIRTRYPHMRSSEAELWTLFLQTTELQFESIEYDTHLGVGIPPVPGEAESTTKLKAAVTRKRVDAIGHTAENIWIFELKHRLGLGALGQLLAYYDLYTQEYPATKPISLAAIAHDMQPDLLPTYSLYAVEIFII